MLPITSKSLINETGWVSPKKDTIPMVTCVFVCSAQPYFINHFNTVTMQTNTQNTVVALNGFLLIASSANSAKQYHLLILNQYTGKCDSMVMDGELPESEAKLRDEFYAMICICEVFGFKTFEQYQAACSLDGLELPITDALEEYNQIAEKSRFLLATVGSCENISALAGQLQ